MRQFSIVLFLLFPCVCYAQDFKIKVNGLEVATDKIPAHVTLPNRVEKFMIKKEVADSTPATYRVQIGEEEHLFLTDGAYHEVAFSHDVRDLVIYILNDKRSIQDKPFILKKP